MLNASHMDLPFRFPVNPHLQQSPKSHAFGPSGRQTSCRSMPHPTLNSCSWGSPSAGSTNKAQLQQPRQQRVLLGHCSNAGHHNPTPVATTGWGPTAAPGPAQFSHQQGLMTGQEGHHQTASPPPGRKQTATLSPTTSRLVSATFAQQPV